MEWEIQSGQRTSRPSSRMKLYESYNDCLFTNNALVKKQKMYFAFSFTSDISILSLLTEAAFPSSVMHNSEDWLSSSLDQLKNDYIVSTLYSVRKTTSNDLCFTECG